VNGKISCKRDLFSAKFACNSPSTISLGWSWCNISAALAILASSSPWLELKF